MSAADVQRNIETFRRFQREVIVGGDFSVYDELVSPCAVTLRSANVSLRALEGRPLPDGNVPMDKETFAAAWKDAMNGRADQERHFEEIRGVDDIVVARWTLTWTHDTPTHGAPPTGRRISHDEVGFIRFDDQGRIVEGWYMTDPLELLQELGARVTVEGS